MNYFNNEEHIGCQYHLTDQESRFRYCEIPAGQPTFLKEKRHGHLIWIISGSLLINFNDEKPRTFVNNEMLFLPKYADCSGVALSDTALLLLIHDMLLPICDKTHLFQLNRERLDREFVFKGVEIRQPMADFVKSMVRYLTDGLLCSQLHEAKRKELFLIFRSYYSRSEQVDLFFHHIGENLNFKERVQANYPLAKTAEDLANLCGCDYKTFLRLFHAHFYQTPYQWMQEQTSIRVHARLSEKDLSIKAIAKEFGFSSPSHLTTYCKKRFGMTPLQLRGKMRG